MNIHVHKGRVCAHGLGGLCAHTRVYIRGDGKVSIQICMYTCIKENMMRHAPLRLWMWTSDRLT